MIARRASHVVAAAVAALALAAPRGAAAGSWWLPEFALSRPESLALLPVEASIVRGKVNDAEPMIAESALLERAVAASVTATLEAKGYRVEAAALQPPALQADRALNDAVIDVVSRMEEELGVMSGEPRSIRTGRFSIGDLALPLARAAQCDGLVLVRARSVIPSKGARALSGVFSTIFGGVPYVPLTKVEVLAVIVDARTGEIEAVFDDVVSGPVLKETEKVANEAVRTVLRAYPRKGETLPLSKRERRELESRTQARAAEPKGPEAPEEEEVVAAFERVYAGSEPPAEPEEDAAPAPEPVPPAEPWTPDGEPVSVSENLAGRPAAARPPEPPAVPASEAAAAVAAGPDAEASALHAVPSERRPAPSHQAILQVTDGEPSRLVVSNESRDALRVSIDLARFVRLAPGEALTVALPPNSHRVLVVGPEGRERMRAAVMVLAGRVTRLEIWPL